MNLRYKELDDYYDITEQVGSMNYQVNNNKMDITHNWKMFFGLGLVFVIGGLQALQGLNMTNGLETLIPALLMIEHILYGNTGVN